MQPILYTNLLLDFGPLRVLFFALLSQIILRKNLLRMGAIVINNRFDVF
jgi:hypothetical protein